MDYRHTALKSSIVIKSIVSIHYFEYMSDFVFPGEQHDFWELVCVDKGEIRAQQETGLSRSNAEISCSTGQENSTMLSPTAGFSPSLVVISFDFVTPKP